MVIINLQVEQDEIYTFQSSYRLLSVLRQRIWLRVLWYVSTYPTAFPTQKRLAESCNCSRSAISEAFRIFQDLGWLVLISRGYKKSKVLIVPPQFQAPELYQGNGLKKTSFVYERATYRATPIKISIKEEETSKATGSLKSLFEEEIGKSLPHYISRLNISIQDKVKLSLVSERAYQDAKHHYNRMIKKGFKPKNEVRYFVGTAINIAINLGEVINWFHYYKTLRRCS